MHIDRLLKEGFKREGKWELPGNLLKPTNNGTFRRRGASYLYAFVIGERVCYIGKTEGVLVDRLDQYRYRKDEHATRIRDLIKDAIRSGESVEIYSRRIVDERERDAEETRLISALQRPWNRTFKV